MAEHKIMVYRKGHEYLDYIEDPRDVECGRCHSECVVTGFAHDRAIEMIEEIGGEYEIVCMECGQGDLVDAAYGVGKLVAPDNTNGLSLPFLKLEMEKARKRALESN